MDHELSDAEKADSLPDLLVNSTFAKSLGLSLDEQRFVPATDLVGPAWEFTFKGQNERRLIFDYSPVAGDKDYIVIRIADILQRQSFFLKYWLKVHSIHHRPAPFKLSSYPGSFHEQSTAFVQYLDQLLCRPDMMAILMGNEWEDIPFDWGDLK
ncbi:hypothetical protein [Blastopirellula marina]|nr:hypothetical protein [Blastopirellula marina]